MKFSVHVLLIAYAAQKFVSHLSVGKADPAWWGCGLDLSHQKDAFYQLAKFVILSFKIVDEFMFSPSISFNNNLQ